MNTFDHYRPMLFTAVLFCMQPLATAHAHKLNIFAWPVQGGIQGEAVFSGGRRAKNIIISVEDAETHQVLLETVSDEQGEFNFAVPELALQEHLNLLIAANAGEGHRGEWLLPAVEYLNAGTPREEEFHERKKIAKIDEQLIRRITAEEIKRELTPIRRTLAESRERKPEFRDILGGIGCIIGLVSLLSWLRNKKGGQGKK